MTTKNDYHVIGQSELIDFPEFDLARIPARIDTGARTCAIWASDIQEADGLLSFRLFDRQSRHYSGKEIQVRDYDTRVVTPSNGLAEERYMVKMLVNIEGRKIRCRFTLANR